MAVEPFMVETTEEGTRLLLFLVVLMVLLLLLLLLLLWLLIVATGHSCPSSGPSPGPCCNVVEWWIKGKGSFTNTADKGLEGASTRPPPPPPPPGYAI